MADEARLYSRFVKPIYEAIDSRQYKNAIKLCQNKKVAALDIVQVLKAHCLERTGRPDEALEICRAVQRRKPTDETVLSTMSLVFRLCGVEHEMVPSYEHACALDPPNEELLMLLFVAYVRKGDFLKQQHTALKMFKAFNKIKYVCWAALSMLMQVEHAGTPPKMLALADRMLLKTMRDTKSDDGEALQLLVHILQIQNKHDEALEAFDEFAPLMVDAASAKSSKTKAKAKAGKSDQTTKGRASEGLGAYEEDIELGPLQAIDRLALEATLAKRVGQLKRSGEVFKTLLNKFNADDWTYLTEFMDARIQENDGGEFSEVETKLLGTLRALAQKPGNEFCRGPWLALVHLQSEKLKHVQTADAAIRKSEEAALVEQIVRYADRFSTKTCCFSDLKQYFELFDDAALVSETSKADLIRILHEMTTQATADTTADSATAVHEESSRKEALNRLHRRLFSLKSLRFVGAFKKSSVAELESLVKALVAEYEANAWLNVGAKGGQREVQNTDDLLLLAAHTLIDVHQRCEGESVARRRDVLVEAATLLEYGLEKSAYNFQMKLLLSRVYAYLGASAAMRARHSELDIKHVQLDSLSYLVFDKLLQLCDHVEARRLCELILRQHRTTNNETPEFISRAYKLGVYSKVLDMTSFLREKMHHSHALAIARGEALQFELQDALTSGPSELTQLLQSQPFTRAVRALETMVSEDNARPLSQNQHRSVVVQWTKTPLVASSASFSRDDEPLVECDRSADFESSVTWIQLQLVVPQLLQRVTAAKRESDSNEALAASYERIVRSLGLIGEGSEEGDVKMRLWQWSVDVVKTMAQVVSAEPSGDLVEKVVALQTPLPVMRDGILASLSCGKSLSAYGLSAVALLLRDAGLWAGALLGATYRAVAKAAGSKKDDPLVMALRSVLKSVQELLVGVELHVQALEIGPVTEQSLHLVVAAAPSADLSAAQQSVVANVTRAHTDTVALLSQLLKNAALSMRLFLQK